MTADALLNSVYEGRRSASLLKIKVRVLYSVSPFCFVRLTLVGMFLHKTFYDAEARVTGYVSGKGRLAGITGALQCEMESGKKFNVGSGLSDKQRKNPPKIGSIITYRFQELTRDGVPRLYNPLPFVYI
jgi:ATP-dependent DNA ligase